jgi:hypothetical protein
MNRTDTYIAFLGHYFLVCALILWFIRSIAPLPVRRAIPVIPVAVFLLFLLPVNGLPVAGYIRGIAGDLSITSIILLGSSVLGRMTGNNCSLVRAQRLLLPVAALAGLALYPFALGLTRFDAYRLGFESPWLLLAIFALVLGAWKTHPSAAIILLCAMASFHLGLLESTNLWDYLIDPWFVLFSWGWAALNASQKLMSRPKPDPLICGRVGPETGQAASAVPSIIPPTA